jgi:hypothetical protein
MFGGRIEMPLEEFNAMKSKIDEFEKVLNSISGEAAKYKELSEEMKSLLGEISAMTIADRFTSWFKMKEKIDKFLKEE